MTAVIIEKKKVEKLGKKVLKELFEFFDNDYTKENLPKLKAKKEEILRRLVYEEFINRHNTVKQSGSRLEFSYEKYDESKFEEDLKRITSEIKNESLDVRLIFIVLICQILIMMKQMMKMYLVI